jgi:hypothetical protein
MSAKLRLNIHTQPDDSTCGPTCLHAIYAYYHYRVPVDAVIDSVSRVKGGGTLAVMLANDALRRGFGAQMFTYNLQMFDPSWAHLSQLQMIRKLEKQQLSKRNAKLRIASRAYIEFLRRGGQVKFEDLTVKLLLRYLQRGAPVLAGLSATYLYQSPRESLIDNRADDVAGYPSGHFVVIFGYDKALKKAWIADPYLQNPYAKQNYTVSLERLVCAILLGIVTDDANLLVIRPPSQAPIPPRPR